MTEEARARNVLFRNLMSVTHREYSPLVVSFREALEQDPDFISRACVHICTGGSNIRDQQDAAIITLLQASPIFPEYREAGRCLLLGNSVYDLDDIVGLPPFRIFRIERFIRQSDRKIPRLMKSVVIHYLRTLECDPMWFDGVVLRNRRAIKSAYKHYHIRPTARTQAILFDNLPPADSRLAILKQIAHSDDPREQAKLVIKHKIPYVVATSVLPKISPVVGIALVGAMSPTEALNSRAWVERSGLLNIPEVKDVYVAKVAEAQASVASAEHRVSTKGVDREVEAAVTKAKEEAVKKEQRIERDTLILVDRSSSMEPAIEIAQQFGSRLAPICDGDLMVVAFNDYAQVVEVEDPSYAGWQTAFRGIRTDGWTSMEAGLNLALNQGFGPEQIVVITDGGENRGSFVRGLKKLEDNPPHIVVLWTAPSGQWQGRISDTFTSSVERAGYRVDKFEINPTNPDYYLYDQVAALLGGPPALSLVERILQTKLPRRKSFVSS